MSKRERLRQFTIDEIKTFARRQIAENGPEALSLNGIARQMGISGPAMYRYFSSRAELVQAISQDALNELLNMLSAQAEIQTGSCTESITQLSAAYRHWADTHFSEYLLIFSAAPVQSSSYAAEIAQIFSKTIGKSGPEGDLICWSLLAQLHGLVLIEGFHTATEMDTLFEHAIANFIRGMQHD